MGGDRARWGTEIVLQCGRQGLLYFTFTPYTAQSSQTEQFSAVIPMLFLALIGQNPFLLEILTRYIEIVNEYIKKNLFITEKRAINCLYCGLLTI